MILITPRKPSNFTDTDRAARAYVSSPSFKSTRTIWRLPKRLVHWALVDLPHILRWSAFFRTSKVFCIFK